MKSPILAITPGDPEGIGPEICLKILRARKGMPASARFLFVGARKPFDELGAAVVEVSEEELLSGKARPPASGSVWLLPAPTRTPRKRLFLPGYQSGWAIETVVRLVHAGVARALVTGPISKERLQRGGFPYPGHTEFLAQLCSRRGSKTGVTQAGGPAVTLGPAAPRVTPPVTMMLANDHLRISLVTTHIGIARVSHALTRVELRRAIVQTAEHLGKWWGIRRPRIAVAALNPHAGEGGLFGDEEIRVIAPEIRALRKKFGKTVEILGPLPADTLFVNHLHAPRTEKYDAVVCMYHDQGLIPVKLLDFKNTVNVTLGLSIVRTSVDHGVGFDIVGTGKADPSSLRAAVQMAMRITEKNRVTGKAPKGKKS